MTREEALKFLKLDRTFTMDEVMKRFVEVMSKIREQENENNKVIRIAIRLNEIVSILRPYATRIGSSDSIFSDKMCCKFGLTYGEAESLYKKQPLNKYKNLSDFLIQLDTLYNEKVKSIRFILPHMRQAEGTWNIPFDRLTSIYFSDTSNEHTLEGYITYLAYICSEFEKLNINETFSLEDVFKEFIESKDKNFLVFLSEKVEIKYYCSVLGQEEYKLRHEYEYYRVDNFRGSFAKYLEMLYEMKIMRDELELSEKKEKKLYDEYLELKPYGSKYECIKDFYLIKDYCNKLPSLYLAFKSEYLGLPREKRVSDFITWVNLRKVREETGFTSDQLLEQIYLRAVSKGFDGTINDFISSMITLNNKNHIKRLS